MLGSAPISAAIVKEQLLVGHDCQTVLSHGEHGLRSKHIISFGEHFGAFSIKEVRTLLARGETQNPLDANKWQRNIFSYLQHWFISYYSYFYSLGS